MARPPFDQVEKQHVIDAIAQIDADGVPTTRRAKGFDVFADGKTYPPKYLLSLAGKFATGKEFDPADFSGGQETNSVLQSLGFDVRPRETQSMRDGLEQIMQKYVSARNGEKFGAEHPLWSLFKDIRTTLRDVEAIRSRPNPVVRSSIGQGNWAKVPWIAILDGRETETTQHGVYCVFLFRQDMTGVYLALAQGVTEPRRSLGSVAAREFMGKNAGEIRSNLTVVIDFGFQLDDNVDLHADPRDLSAGSTNRPLWMRSMQIQQWSPQNRPCVDVSKPAMWNGLRQVLFYLAERSLARPDSVAPLRVKLVLFPPGSRLAETSRAESAGLAPKESATETLCKWAVMADCAKGFVFLPLFFW